MLISDLIKMRQRGACDDELLAIIAAYEADFDKMEAHLRKANKLELGVQIYTELRMFDRARSCLQVGVFSRENEPLYRNKQKQFFLFDFFATNIFKKIYTLHLGSNTCRRPRRWPNAALAQGTGKMGRYGPGRSTRRRRNVLGSGREYEGDWGVGSVNGVLFVNTRFYKTYFINFSYFKFFEK